MVLKANKHLQLIKTYLINTMCDIVYLIEIVVLVMHQSNCELLHSKQKEST
jgi:hypothetical protein